MDGLAKLLICIGIFLASLLPVWVVSIAYCVIGPSNFMESALVVGIGAYFCAGIQITLLLLALALIAFIVFEDF